MSQFTSMPNAVATLAAADAPVIFLDTCVFFDVVRSIDTGTLLDAESFRSLQEHLATAPRPIQLVVTYLVRHEWEQNKEGVIKQVDDSLAGLSKRVERIDQACQIVRLPAARRDALIVDPALSRALFDLAESILDHSIVLERYDPCVTQALERVMDQRRPSHTNQIKDSIHWEHYLELSTQLKASGHAEHRILVSSNKKDFWSAHLATAIYQDLKAEADEAGLQFFGKLDLALRQFNL